MKSTTSSEARPLGTGWINLFLGIWLVISPFALGFSHYTGNMINNVAAGVALVLVTLAGIKNELIRALMVVIGIELYIASIMIVCPSGAYLWNDMLMAPLVIAIAASSESPGWAKAK